MTTEEIVALSVYVLALLVLTWVFHRRYRCVRASVLTGLCAALSATSTLSAFSPARFNPLDYIASFVWFGVTPAIVGAVLSALMGAAIQMTK